MKAMILAAGYGTRLLPLTNEKPKPVMPILGKPLLGHTLELLQKAGVNEVVVNLHHLPEEIEERLGSGEQYGLKIIYSHEPEILGSGGGLKKAEPFLKDETFFLINGDILFDMDLKQIFQFHRQKKAFATMVLRRDKKAKEYGAIGIDENGRIRQFLGEPDCNGAELQELMFTGVHVLEPEIFDYLPPANTFSNINRIGYPKLLTKKNIFGYPFDGYWRECGNPEEYFQTNMELLKKSPQKDFKQNGVEIIAPVWIGENCQISEGVTLGPNVILGKQCKIGKKSKISNALLWDEVIVQENEHLDKLILSKKQKIIF